MTASMSTTVAATMTVLVGMFVLGVLIALGTWVLSCSDHDEGAAARQGLLLHRARVRTRTAPKSTPSDREGQVELMAIRS